MIKNLIFDFGNIFITLNQEKIFPLLDKIGLDKLPEDLMAHNMAYEKGLLSSPEHIAFYQKLWPHSPAEDFVKAWNSVLVDFPKSRFDFLQNLADSGDYQLFLLSNTNEMHMDWVAEHIPFFNGFKNLFDKFYLSHEIHLRKPDREIFEFVIKDAQIRPEESLFIDDTMENITTARAIGFHTWNLNPLTEDVTELFIKKANVF